MAFRFRKLYADLVADAGTVLIVYLAWVEAWGLSRALAGYELYPASGAREVCRARGQPVPSAPGRPGDPLELFLVHSGGSLSLRYEPLYPGWEPGRDAPLPGLHWSVRVPRAAVTAAWAGPRRGPDLAGTGYVDWVELTRPTRLLGLRALEWGRLHLPDRTLIFTGVRSRSGTWWRRIAQWRGPGCEVPMEHDGYRLKRGGDGVLHLEPGRPGAGPASAPLVLRPQRVLHSGSVLDPARSPGRLERLGMRLVTGPSAETRWFSRVETGPSDRNEPPGMALHEVVRFGR